MKIIAGVHADYQGEMRLDGRPVRFASPRDALAAGIGMVHQELSAVPRAVGGGERLSRHAAGQPARPGRLARDAPRRGASISTASASTSIRARRMGALPIGLQQLVELARVLFSGARIIILDEPTSALSPPEVERLFALLRRLRDGRAQHHLHLAFPRRRAGDLRPRDGVPQRPDGRDRAVRGRRQALGHRPHDRRRARGAGGELSLRHPAAQPAGRAGRAGAGGVEPRRRLSATCRSRCAAARCWASTAFSAPGSSNWRAPCSAGCRRSAGASALDGRSRAAVVAPRGRGGRGWRSCRRAAAMMLFAAEPVFKNMTIAILDRIHRLWLRPGAERAIAARQWSGCASARPTSSRRSARCRAATSRRWRWRSGSPICRACWC